MTGTPSTTRPHPATAQALALAATLAIGLAGCGDGGREDTQAHDGEAPDEAPMGAVDRLFQAAYEGTDQDASNSKQMQGERLTAECMAEQGFEYIPVDFAAAKAAAGDGTDAEEDRIAWGTLEVAKQWGYGITTDPYAGSEEADPAPVDEWVDPNTAITDAMNETELAAYEEALYGPQSDEPADPEAEWVAPSWEEMGCYGYAQHELYGDDAFGEDPYQSLMEEVDAMHESVDADDRVVAAAAEWSSCMAGAGHPNLAAVGDGEQVIWDKVDPIWESVSSGLAQDATDAEWDAAAASAQEQIAAFTDEEIALATADYTCREEVGYEDAYNEANLELQQQFYDTHKTELDAWVADVQEQSS